MFRRALSANAATQLATLARSSRSYINHQHFKYPVYNTALVAIAGYFIVAWFVFARMGSRFSGRGEYKHDFMRVWRHKLGTGYQWADAWGPSMDTLYKNLPEAVEDSE